METFELRYFLAVARRQNLHRAAVDIAISPGSLSKAIARLESELAVKLFRRVGRNIELTASGIALQSRAAEIVRLEEATRLELQGKTGHLNARIAGPEIALSGLGLKLAQELRHRHARLTVEFLPVDDQETLELVQQGTAHLGLTTGPVPRGLKAKTLAHTTFQTVVGKGHPLHGAAKAGRTVPVEEVLTHPFASAPGVLGNMTNVQFPDGWRDDIFPRRIGFVTQSLKLIEDLVTNGLAIAYLPDYLVARLDVSALKISGCPYTCKQEIKLVAKNPRDVAWLQELLSNA